MTKEELKLTLDSIVLETLYNYDKYFQSMQIAGGKSSMRMREMLRALHIYIMVLEYYYYIDVDKTAITENDINNTIEEANGLLRTFNPYE
jgi:hypothetical protein